MLQLYVEAKNKFYAVIYIRWPALILLPAPQDPLGRWTYSLTRGTGRVISRPGSSGCTRSWSPTTGRPSRGRPTISGQLSIKIKLPHQTYSVLSTNQTNNVQSPTRSMPNSKKDYDGIEPCAVGSTVEVLVSTSAIKKLIWFNITPYTGGLL